MDYQLDATTRRLWIPRTDIYLQDTASDDDWTLITAGDANDAFSGNVTFNDEENVMRTVYTGSSNGTISYANAAKLHKYYDDTKLATVTADHAANRFTSVTALTDLENQDSSIIILDPVLHDTINGETYYYGKCRVNLWIEGCDAEARRAIDGGAFLFGFDLKGEL